VYTVAEARYLESLPPMPTQSYMYVIVSRNKVRRGIHGYNGSVVTASATAWQTGVPLVTAVYNVGGVVTLPRFYRSASLHSIIVAIWPPRRVSSTRSTGPTWEDMATRRWL